MGWAGWKRRVRLCERSEAGRCGRSPLPLLVATAATRVVECPNPAESTRGLAAANREKYRRAERLSRVGFPLPDRYGARIANCHKFERSRFHSAPDSARVAGLRGGWRESCEASSRLPRARRERRDV